MNKADYRLVCSPDLMRPSGTCFSFASFGFDVACSSPGDDLESVSFRTTVGSSAAASADLPSGSTFVSGLGVMYSFQRNLGDLYAESGQTCKGSFSVRCGYRINHQKLMVPEVLYRRRFLQVNTRWKALAEIYTMHSFAPFINLKISAKNRQHFFAIACLIIE